MILYVIVATLFFYLILPFYFFERLIKQKSVDWKKKFGFCKKVEGDVILLYACSVGEVMVLSHIIPRLRQEFPNYKIVVATATTTGQEVAQKEFFNIADLITYFPFDSYFEMNRFLNRINPKIALVVETEIWPCFAYLCKKKNISLNIINGRISDGTYKSYKLLKPFFKTVLKNYDTIYTQSKEDNEKFLS